ncbi:transposable element Tcb1 transposase [Trichonephila clavipes]|nr:transposable element Tcb1 transposase [Trichonephila clavipes]
MKHLDNFLRGRIIGRLECGRTQLEVSEELEITQSVISRLWQRFQDDVTAKRNRQSTASDLSRQLSSATGTTVSRQTVFRRLGHIGLYARRPVRCVPLTATHCRLRLTWSREHALLLLQDILEAEPRVSYLEGSEIRYPRLSMDVFGIIRVLLVKSFIVLMLSRKRDESPIVAEALQPVGPCFKTSLDRPRIHLELDEYVALADLENYEKQSSISCQKEPSAT